MKSASAPLRPLLSLCCIAFAIGQQPAAAESISLFDGKTFQGWEGDTEHTWRIEDGALTAGSLTEKQPRNEFLATTRRFGDFDLSLQWRLRGTEGFVNGGVQFRSQRIPRHHEVIGYQADLGKGYDGALYDESRRRVMLAQPSPEVLQTALRPLGEWNDYRIRAEGPRIQIWLNGVQTVDYTEQDASIPQTGLIAVQIHGNATSLVEYKDLVLEELPSQSAPKKDAALEIRDGEVFGLAGGSNMERTRLDGFLQTHLIAARPEAQARVRNFGWEGDTVFEQWRDNGNLENLDPKRAAAERRIQRDAGTTAWRQQRDWREQLKEAGVTTVMAQFGQMEALAGKDGLEAFTQAYEQLIEDFSADGRRVILISPLPFEGSLAEHNVDVAAYALAIQHIATQRRLTFVDLSLLPPGPEPLTTNGWQLSEDGRRLIAEKVIRELGLNPSSNEEARQQVIELEDLWFNYWRPMNWAFLSGDRTNVPFSRDWRDSSKRIFPQEMLDFIPLLKQADHNIWQALQGKTTTPIAMHSSIPVEPSSIPAQSPDEELASFKIQDGFALNLFASEADGIVNPIQMRWDERGRLWVACTTCYPQIKPGQKANDYVMICEDTDGDGRADHFHKWVEGLFMPCGIELGDGGLYVAQGTELLHFKDSDGDGHADTRRIVLGGFGTADSHQMINCLNWGFGGELWFSQGHHIYSRVETPFGVETLNRAGVWRYRTRTGHLDPFFQWSSAGANCWGVVTTEYGQAFHKSGANIGAYYTTPGMIRSTLAVDSQAMNLCLAPIKQVGMEFLHSSHFPDEMQGRILIGGYYANLLEWHQLNEQDGLFSTTLLPNILETSNNVFRPIEIRMGPDGAMYVADWYNPIIGHYQASYRHPDRDNAHGRIWRVTWKNRPLVKPAPLATATTPQLLDSLDSKERWEWYQAKRLLIEKEDAEVLAALEAWLPAQKGNDLRRLQALSLYEAHESPQPDLLRELLRSKDARVRAYATRVIGTWARDGRLPDALQLLETQIADTDPLVRLEAIVAASYVHDPRAAVVAARALDQPFNAYHQHALIKTLHASHALWAPLLLKDKLAFDKDEHLIFALQNGWVENNPDDFRELSGGAVNYHPQNHQDAASLMRQQVLKQREDPARQKRWLKALAAAATPQDVPFIFEHGGKSADILAALSSERPPQAEALVTTLLENTEPALRQQGLRLAGVWKLTSLTDRIRQMVTESPTPVGNQALIRLAPDAVAASTLKEVSAAQTVEEAAATLSRLLSVAEGHNALLRALKKPNALSPASAKTALQALNQIGKTDTKISPILMELAGINSALPPYTKAHIANIVKAAQSVGKVEEGRKVFEQSGCIACHMPGAPQSQIGPDLSAVSRGLPIDMIVTEVIWPGINVKENYEAATATLKDGTVISGFKQTDSADSISIRDLTGKIHPIDKASTESIKIGGTVMPDGLTANLDDLQLAHLIKYLSQLGK